MFTAITVEVAGVTIGLGGIAVIAFFAVLFVLAFLFGDPITKGGRAIRNERATKRIEKSIEKSRRVER